MVINQLIQLNLGSKVQMIAYADDLQQDSHWDAGGVTNLRLTWMTEKQQLQYSIHITQKHTKKSQDFYKIVFFLSQIHKHN